LPCLPVDRAGSDWTPEKVPEKQDQSALCISFFFKCLPREASFCARARQRGAITIEGYPKLQLPSLRRTLGAPSSKTFGAIARYEMDAIPYRICSLRGGHPGTCLAIRGDPKKRTQDINGAFAQKYDAGNG
jgi:hypothetical protein